jgi:hypothetical protein
VSSTAIASPGKRGSSFGVRWENWSKKCANPDCHISPLRAIFKGQGIRISEDWFCGVDCLEASLRERFADLAGAARPAETQRRARVPLGLMLFSRGYLSEEQFKTTLDAHRHTGARLGDVALQFGYVSEEQVAAALAGQWGYPVFSFKNASAQLPLLVPFHLMELHQMLPIQFIDDSTKLLVGFATRVEHSVVQGVERMLGCAVAPCFVTMSDFRARMQVFSSMRPATERVFDQIATPLEMAQTVKDCVLQVGASEVRVALCREYLWIRILGASEQPDLLFKLESPTKEQPIAE